MPATVKVRWQEVAEYEADLVIEDATSMPDGEEVTEALGEQRADLVKTATKHTVAWEVVGFDPVSIIRPEIPNAPQHEPEW